MPLVSRVLGGGLQEGGLPARQAAKMAALPGREEGGGTLSAEVKSDVKLNHDRIMLVNASKAWYWYNYPVQR